jgi:membrane fusion protein (multidrug efflux system)
LVLLLPFLLLSTACSPDGGGESGSSGSEDKSEETEEDSIPVRATRVSRADVTRSISATTTLSPRTSVRLVAEVSGTVRDWKVEEGDAVEEGDVLARIEVPELDVQIREARLNLTRIEREVESIRPLHEDGYISEQAWQDALSQQDAARAALDRLQEQSGRQRVISPLDGTVIERAIERGETVSAGALLYQVADLGELVALISIPERDLAQIDEGMTAELTIPAAGDDEFTGTIDRIAPTIDETTGTISVRIDVEGEQEASLRPGMFTTVRIATETRRDVLTVPARAIIEEGDQRSVFVVRDSDGALTVERVFIELGLREQDRQQVLSGLEEDDRVVTVGQSRLRDGARIRLTDDGGA